MNKLINLGKFTAISIVSTFAVSAFIERFETFRNLPTANYLGFSVFAALLITLTFYSWTLPNKPLIKTEIKARNTFKIKP